MFKYGQRVKIIGGDEFYRGAEGVVMARERSGDEAARYIALDNYDTWLGIPTFSYNELEYADKKK